jgi:Na+/melibiose symporter-like transporter
MAGIRFMFSVFPAAFAIMGIVAIYFYRIDRNTIEEIERDLSVRHDTA